MNDEDVVTRLRSLKLHCNEVIDEISKAQKVGRGEAINWADLLCREAMFITNDSGDSYYSVSVEEASPDATDFRDAVSEKLAGRGFGHVIVTTEW